jgi:hypothetical protein
MPRTEHPNLGRAKRRGDDAEGPERLRSLQGKPTPPSLAADLRRLSRLPEAARATLWSVLGPCLAEPLPAQTEGLLDAFCRAHRLQRDDLAGAVKACRFLLREAAGANVARATFVQDLRALGGDDEAVEQFFLAGYDAACKLLRQEILQGTLADHGKLLVGADWRLDSVEASSRGSKMRVPVALLTLRFRDGEKTGRITLQVLPETLRELRETLSQIAP